MSAGNITVYVKQRSCYSPVRQISVRLYSLATAPPGLCYANVTYSEYGGRVCRPGQKVMGSGLHSGQLRPKKGDLPPMFRVPRQSGLTTQVPPHIQAVSGRTEAEKALVDFIVHSQGAEQHLMNILGGKPSKWAVVKQVPVYLDSEEEQKTLFTHFKSLLDRTQATVKYIDEVQFICEVLFPEAIIYGISAVNAISWEEAEQVFLAGPLVHQSEVDEFCRRLERQMRKEGALPQYKGYL